MPSKKPVDKARPFSSEQHVREGGMVKDVVLGMNDGLVSIFSLVAGISAAAASSSFIIVAGVAGGIAGALSMAFGTYISHKSQNEFFEEEFNREKYEMEHLPEVEKEEIRTIYRAKGFQGKQLEDAVKTITSNKQVWLDVMMLEELGLSREGLANPIKRATANGLAFAIAACVPIIPFLVLSPQSALFASAAFSLLALFAAGAVKSKFTKKNWLKSGFEMVLVGAAAAVVTFAIGSFFNVNLS